MIIDLLDGSPKGQGVLSKISVKLDGQGNGTYLYDVHIAFHLASSKEAEVLEKLIPGAKESYIRANEKDDWKQTQTVVPDIVGAKIVVTSETGGIAMQGGAEIKGATFQCSKKASVLTLKFRSAGQEAGAATPLIHLLGKAVNLDVEAAQQALPFGRASVQISLGSIAVAKDANGDTVWGRVSEIGDEVILSTFSGEDEVVEQNDIVTCYALPAGDHTENALKDYAKRCKKRKVNPDYRALTIALSETYAGVASNGGTHPLTGEIVERAVELTVKPGDGPPDGKGTVIPIAREPEPVRA